MVSDTPVDSQDKDKVTLGLTPLAAEHLKDLMATDWFATEIDAFRLAIALAIREGAAASPDEMVGLTTKWSTAIDTDQRISSMVRLLVNDEISRPYATAERYGVAGIAYLHRRLVVEKALIAEVMAPEKSKSN